MTSKSTSTTFIVASDPIKPSPSQVKEEPLTIQETETTNERWNNPPVNKYRLATCFTSFIAMSLNLTCTGVRLFSTPSSFFRITHSFTHQPAPTQSLIPHVSSTSPKP